MIFVGHVCKPKETHSKGQKDGRWRPEEMRPKPWGKTNPSRHEKIEWGHWVSLYGYLWAEK